MLPSGKQTTASQPQLILSGDGIWNSIQGEGPRLGRITTFLRLGGCNLTCSWCDTPYTWDWVGRNGVKFNPSEELVHKSLDWVFPVLVNHTASTRSITITGGEPLLQARALDALFLKMYWRDTLYEVNFETNGTRKIPQWERLPAHKVNYVVSPKLRSAKTQPPDPHLLAETSRYDPLYGDVDFKFVCGSIADLDEVQRLVDKIVTEQGGFIPNTKIWIMPQGIDPSELTKTAQLLVDGVVERGWNLTTRFHQYIWNNQRAR